MSALVNSGLLYFLHFGNDRREILLFIQDVKIENRILKTNIFEFRVGGLGQDDINTQ